MSVHSTPVHFEPVPSKPAKLVVRIAVDSAVGHEGDLAQAAVRGEAAQCMEYSLMVLTADADVFPAARCCPACVQDGVHRAGQPRESDAGGECVPWAC